MGVSGIMAVISLVFSTFFGISAFVISLTNLILGIKKNKRDAISAKNNSKTLKQDSERNAEHLEFQEKMDEKKLATLKEMVDLIKKESVPKVPFRLEKESINPNEAPVVGEE